MFECKNLRIIKSRPSRTKNEKISQKFRKKLVKFTFA